MQLSALRPSLHHIFSLSCRKRRLAEKMGLDSHGGKRNGASRLFEDNPEAETLLSNMASLDDDQNR